jgi:uncharacterized membrane protein
MSEEFVPESGVTSDDRLWATLAYIFSPLIPVVILLMDEKKSRPFIKAHNIQALAWGLIGWVVSMILTPVVGVGCIVGVAYLVITIIWAVKANKGEYIEIPVITNFVKGQGWA